MKNSKHIHLRSFFFWLKFHFIHKVINNTLNYKILTLNSRCNTLSVEKLNMRNIAIPNSKVLYFILYSSVSLPVKKKKYSFLFFCKQMKYYMFFWSTLMEYIIFHIRRYYINFNTATNIYLQSFIFLRN